MKKISYIVLAAVIGCTSAFSAGAQGLSMLGVTDDARSLSLGGVGVTLSPDAYSITSNVAAMSLYDGKADVAADYTLWQPASSHLWGVSGFGKIGKKWAVGANFRSSIQKSIMEVSKDGFTKTEFTPSDYFFTVGGSFRIIDGLGVGLNLKVASCSYSSEMKGVAFGVDLGVQYRWKGLSAGLSANNLGSSIQGAKMPSDLRFGVGYDFLFGKFGLGIAAQGNYLFSNSFMAGAGLELHYNSLIFLRGGYHYGKSDTTDCNVIPSYASLGLGVNIKGFHLDASWLFASKALNNTIGVTVGYAF